MASSSTRGSSRNINVGAQFQAELPDLQHRLELEIAEEGASLVWKPWGDMQTNPETQDTVMGLLNTACPRNIPGAGRNIELVLHCLHQTQGNIMEAMELLLSGGPQKSESHPLAGYHYSGCDTWTPKEKQLFRKAFSRHRKNFHRIQKKIRTKTVAQCVEYYYTWKKKIVFDPVRARAKERQRKAKQDQAVGGPRKRGWRVREESPEPQQRAPKKRPRSASNPSQLPPKAGSGDTLSLFACPECGRVLTTQNRRNAHVKRHRAREEDLDYLKKVRWPLKRPKIEDQPYECLSLSSN
ncbi:zinc finger protein 541-like [Phaenicophaeus curvirostris]|uniref:zinc finger protein 541-like n=1 Tax=Phaenicophaeus curvirostris TaxID=33595 RepID=UPI0037F0B961